MEQYLILLPVPISITVSMMIRLLRTAAFDTATIRSPVWSEYEDIQHDIKIFNVAYGAGHRRRSYE